nr:uncharacterized protein LOC110569412 [Aotus nancymaae]
MQSVPEAVIYGASAIWNQFQARISISAHSPLPHRTCSWPGAHFTCVSLTSRALLVGVASSHSVDFIEVLRTLRQASVQPAQVAAQLGGLALQALCPSPKSVETLVVGATSNDFLQTGSKEFSQQLSGDQAQAAGSKSGCDFHLPGQCVPGEHGVMLPTSSSIAETPLTSMHFILFSVWSLVILTFLRPSTPREPTSGPPRKRNGGKLWGQEPETRLCPHSFWSLRVKLNLPKSLEELENAQVYTHLLEKGLRKLPGEGSSHHLPHQDRPGPVFKRAPARNHWPHEGMGAASPTSLSPWAPPAPLASMPSPDLKTSIGSFESLSTLSASQPPEPLCPLKHPSHRPHSGTLLPNPTTSIESLGLPSKETPHAGRGRQGSHFPQPGRAKAAGHTRHQNPRRHPEHRTSNLHQQLGLSRGQLGGPHRCGKRVF